jgi:parvulin-like peptidyl-prolyl isomerase
MAKPKPKSKLSEKTTPLDHGRKVAKDMVEWSTNPTRTLWIGAIGAIFGLVLAGFGLLTAKGTRVRAVPPEAVAMVNGRPVLMADYVAQLESETGKPLAQADAAERKKVLNEMVTEELFVQRGIETDEPSVDPDVRNALVNAVETLVSVDAVTKLPTEDELRAYYEMNRLNYSTLGVLGVKDFVVLAGSDPATTLQNAQAAAAAIRAGTDLTIVAAKYNLRDTGRVIGGELYFAAEIHLGNALYSKAVALKKGQVTDAFVQPDGPHVVFVTENTPPVATRFEDARLQVLTDYKQDLQKRMQANENKFLRDRADILVAKAFQ